MIYWFQNHCVRYIFFLKADVILWKWQSSTCCLELSAGKVAQSHLLINDRKVSGSDCCASQWRTTGELSSRRYCNQYDVALGRGSRLVNRSQNGIKSKCSSNNRMFKTAKYFTPVGAFNSWLCTIRAGPNGTFHSIGVVRFVISLNRVCS